MFMLLSACPAVCAYHQQVYGVIQKSTPYDQYSEQSGIQQKPFALLVVAVLVSDS